MISLEYRAVISENIPEKLKASKIWVVWKPKKEKGKPKPGKIPMSWQNNKATDETEVKPASCDDPDTWMNFEDALKLLKSSKKYKGLSIALPPEPPQEGQETLVCIDIDKAHLPDGTIDPKRLAEIKSFNTYAELSPTDGLRAFCYGSFPINEGVHSGNIEIYQHGKFLSITGHKLSDVPATINVAQKSITEFRAKYFKPIDEIDETELPVSSVKFTDEDLLENLFNYSLSDQFKEMYYNGVKEGEDHSVKDKDLCKLIVFWTQDPEQIDRIFRKSKLFRPEKWDKRHYSNGDTYGQGTIKYALRTRKNVYQPPSNADLNQYKVSLPLYKVDENGIYKINNTKEGDSYELEISTTPCVIIAKGRNIDTGEILYKLKFKDTFRHERVVWKRIRHLTKKTDVLELLNDGMFFQEKNANDIIDYFFTFLKTCGNQLQEEIVVSKSGWKNKYSQFVIGNKLVSKGGIKDILQTDNPAVSMYIQEGNLQEWVKGAKYFFKFRAVRFKAYATFSPILLKLLEIPNYLFEQCCKTGRLKSFSNKLCASMFGHPTRLQLDPDSTKVGLVKLTEACTNLPMFLDETSQNPVFILNLLYRFSNANTRVKSNTAQGLDISPDFSTAIFATGEDPIITENAKGGQDARRVSEKIGVPEKVPVDIVNKAKMVFNNNYGHVAVLFLQELFIEIDSITEIYTKFFKSFPESNDITSDRVKEYYACIATAGYFLEKVFAKLGIESEDPMKICSEYFEQNVLNEGIIPDHIKMLRIAYSWYTSNGSHFGDADGSEICEENDKIANNEKYGYICTTKGELTINFVPEALKAHLIKTLGTKDGANRYESAKEMWKTLGILNPTIRVVDGKEKVLTTSQIRFKGKKVSVLQIPLKNFYERLELTEELPEPLKVEYPEPQTIKDILETGNDLSAAKLLMQEGI